MIKNGIPRTLIGTGTEDMEALQSMEPEAPMLPDNPRVVSIVDEALFIVTPEVETLQSSDN